MSELSENNAIEQHQLRNDHPVELDENTQVTGENHGENHEVKPVTADNEKHKEDTDSNMQHKAELNAQRVEQSDAEPNIDLNADSTSAYLDQASTQDHSSELLSDSELKERYGEKYEFQEALSNNEKFTCQFLFYTAKRFLLGKDRNEMNATADEIIKKIRSGASDYEIYRYMREAQEQTLQESKMIQSHLKESIEKEATLRDVEKRKYFATIDAKVKKLTGTLYNNKIRYGRNGEIVKVLDIGTEKLDFLDSLFHGLKLMNVNGTVNGINIDDGFCHYDPELFQTNKTDTRFNLYDGKRIPHEDGEMDLITMYSVIHHIPTEDFKVVATDIARVCGKYLFIKDVDMSDKVENIFFRIQHYLYEGILTPGKTSYLNDEVKIENTLKILEIAGFEVIEKYKVDNFNGTYWALLRKRDYNRMKRKREDNFPYHDEFRNRRPRYESNQTYRNECGRVGPSEGYYRRNNREKHRGHSRGHSRGNRGGNRGGNSAFGGANYRSEGNHSIYQNYGDDTGYNRSSNFVSHDQYGTTHSYPNAFEYHENTFNSTNPSRQHSFTPSYAPYQGPHHNSMNYNGYNNENHQGDRFH